MVTVVVPVREVVGNDCKPAAPRESDDDSKPHASSDDDDSDGAPDGGTDQAVLKEMFKRRRPGETKFPNALTGDTRKPQQSLQPPRRQYPRIDWSNSPEELKKVKPCPIYVPPLPEYRDEFELTNSDCLHDGRWGQWTGQWGVNYAFEPDVYVSKSDIDNDAEVYKAPSESYEEPTVRT